MDTAVLVVLTVGGGRLGGIAGVATGACLWFIGVTGFRTIRAAAIGNESALMIAMIVNTAIASVSLFFGGLQWGWLTGLVGVAVGTMTSHSVFRAIQGISNRDKIGQTRKSSDRRADVKANTETIITSSRDVALGALVAVYQTDDEIVSSELSQLGGHTLAECNSELIALRYFACMIGLGVGEQKSAGRLQGLSKQLLVQHSLFCGWKDAARVAEEQIPSNGVLAQQVALMLQFLSENDPDKYARVTRTLAIAPNREVFFSRFERFTLATARAPGDWQRGLECASEESAAILGIGNDKNARAALSALARVQFAESLTITSEQGLRR